MIKALITSVCLFSLLVSCQGSDNSNVPDDVTEPTEPLPQPDPLAVIAEIPTSVLPTQYTSLISLKNSNAEHNPGVQGAPIIDPQIYGWDSEGPCFYMDNYVSAGNGLWRMNMAQGCSIHQTTEHVIAQDQAFSVIFDASSFAGLADSVLLELTTQTTQGGTQVIHSERFSFDQVEFNNWRSYQMLVPYSKLDAHVGRALGIRFSNTSASMQYLSVDNIELEVHDLASSKLASFDDSWSSTCDQVWSGKNYWTNRMMDWIVKDGTLQTYQPHVSLLRRTAHRITTVVNSRPENFKLEVSTGVLSGQASKASYSGFLLGAGFRLDHRAAALIHNRHGKNGGIIAGVNHLGHAFIMDNDLSHKMLGTAQDAHDIQNGEVKLSFSANYQHDGQYKLSLIVKNVSGTTLSQAEAVVPAWRVMGSVALIADPGQEPATPHWFNDFSGEGKKLTDAKEREYGPIMFTSYTLSRQVLTVNAQFPPVCHGAYQNVRLEVFNDQQWKKVADAEIDSDAYTAQLRVFQWDDTQKTKFRVAADDSHGQSHYYYGYIQADPKDKEEIVFAGYTCRPGVILSDEGWMQQYSFKPFTWTEERLTFPHDELINNANKHNADFILFTGDQLYEFDPNGLVDKSSEENIINDYLYKWYIYGWSVRHYLRNTPSLIIPDDHDVFQGNFWGEGGRASPTEQGGGYVYPARFIKIVEKTQTGSLPPPYDASPVEQGIGVYYTDLVYGEVGIAVLEDRKFKSGPNSPDRPRQLLGDRQHVFLDDWVADWEGQQMKLVVSQAPFAMSHTHSGSGFKPSGLDKDSNGWPSNKRDEAVERIRKVFAPHVNGDQHLGLTLKHGIDQPGDAVYSFSLPSMLNIFPRIWDPENSGNLAVGDRNSIYTGSFTDQHGNYLDVIAAANPNTYYEPVNLDKAASKYDLGTGYGIIKVNKPQRSYSFTAWPIFSDPDNANAKPYDGWPYTFKQDDNDGRVPTGHLPAVSTHIANPLVMLIDEADDSLIYAKRLLVSDFTAPVFDNSKSYTIKMMNPETQEAQLFTQLKAVN